MKNEQCMVCVEPFGYQAYSCKSCFRLICERCSLKIKRPGMTEAMNNTPWNPEDTDVVGWLLEIFKRCDKIFKCPYCRSDVGLNTIRMR